MNVALADEFWRRYQPGFRFTEHPPGSPAFFAAVEAHRYRLEPHIPELVGFEGWRGKDVLEAGCGIATDGARFARVGAAYTGVDSSKVAVELAKTRFELEGLAGSFFRCDVTSLPFADESFDLVYSHGVIHHIEETSTAVHEFHRVLRPGGTALVMVYHRGSLNYNVNIMVVRRALAPLLVLPGGVGALSRLTGESRELLEGHRELLHEYGLRYLTDKTLFLSNNTDGPGNVLSKAYSRSEAARLFEAFSQVELTSRFLNLRIWPGGERLARTRPARRFERHWGWHLWITARK